MDGRRAFRFLYPFPVYFCDAAHRFTLRVNKNRFVSKAERSKYNNNNNDSGLKDIPGVLATVCTKNALN